MLSALDITGFLCTCKPLGTNHPLLELYNDQVALPIYSGSYYKTGTTYICIITIVLFYPKNFGHYLVGLCSGEQDKNTRLFPKMLLHDGFLFSAVRLNILTCFRAADMMVSYFPPFVLQY